MWCRNPGGDGRLTARSRRSALMLAEDAESRSGISQQQVSKWRKRLKDPEKYRADLYGPAYRRAMAQGVEDDVHVGQNTRKQRMVYPAGKAFPPTGGNGHGRSRDLSGITNSRSAGRSRRLANRAHTRGLR